MRSSNSLARKAVHTMTTASELKNMKAAWNRRAARNSFYYVETKYWDGHVDKFFSLGEQRTKELIDPVIARLGIDPAHSTALDLGCGLGRFTRALSTRFRHVIGVDISEEMIRQAHELNRDRPNITLVPANGVSIPAEAASVDFLYCYEVFQHMPSHAVIQHNIKEISRVLRRKGHGLLHFRTGRTRPLLLYKMAAALPQMLVSSLAWTLWRDPLTSDLAWRGADPIDQRQISRMCRDHGFTVLAFRDDPTHEPGTRTFAVVRRDRAD
jgi:ubiquinone/menaquinone biosynthesis C-methylase UbiE